MLAPTRRGTVTAGRAITRERSAVWRHAVRRVVGRSLVYAVLIGVSLLFLLPLYWMVATAVRPQALVYAFPPRWFSTDVTFEHFRTGWNALPFGRFLLNSLFVTTLTVTGTVVSSSLVGFGFARYRHRWSGVLFVLLLMTMMVPTSTTVIPRFVLFSKIGWTDSFLPLLVPPWMGAPLFIFLFRQFFRSIPSAYFDTAEVDGASPLRIWWYIALPMAKPAVAATVMFSALSAWNDVLEPLLYLTSTERQTYQIGLSMFQSTYARQLHLLMPMALIGIVPVLLVVIVGQRWIAQGLAASDER